MIVGVFLKQYLANPDGRMLQDALIQAEQASAEGGDFMEPYINMLRVLSIDTAMSKLMKEKKKEKKKKKKEEKREKEREKEKAGSKQEE